MAVNQHLSSPVNGWPVRNQKTKSGQKGTFPEEWGEEGAHLAKNQAKNSEQ
jgi:hypothetical protein